MPPSLLLRWSFEPSVVCGLLVLAGLYGSGLRVLVRRGKRGRLVGWSHVASFALGWLALLLALESPIDTLGLDLFSVHMVQHLLLLMVAPAFLLLGKPVPTLLLGAPRPLVKALVRAHARTGWLRALTRRLTSLRVVWAAYVGDFLLWHMPALYQGALAHPGLHALEHLCFFATGLLFWWIVVEPLPGSAPRHPGLRLVFAWSPLLPTIGLGSLFALTDQPWYPLYAQAPRLWGPSVLDDQRLGGIIMWLGGGMMYVTAASVLFFVMLAAEERAALSEAEPVAVDAVVGGAEPR